MQRGFRLPGRFLLAHPFNPPHLIPLVEILGNEQTDEEAILWTTRLFEHCGKQTIRLRKEVPGHVANRLQAALWREAIHLGVEGVASVEDVDKAIVHGPGLRWAVYGSAYAVQPRQRRPGAGSLLRALGSAKELVVRLVRIPPSIMAGGPASPRGVFVPGVP